MTKTKTRLRQAWEQAGYSSPTDAWRENRRELGVGKDLFISNSNGNRNISKRSAERYAAVFGHTPGWYLFGQNEAKSPEALVEKSPSIIDVPKISWITAGDMNDHDAVVDLSDFPTIAAADLPAGRYIALQLEPNAHSMNKISPPESIIFVNLDDRRLVPNGCYVIADEQGRATYKRYRPNEDQPFQPASYDDMDAPELKGAIRVIGRVRRSMIDM